MLKVASTLTVSVAVTILTVAGGGTAVASKATTANCRASPVYYEKLVNSGVLATLPWIAPKPRSTMLVGHLFYYNAFASVPWAKRHVRSFRIFTGGRSRDDKVNMKILWSAPSPLSGKSLVIHGTRVDDTRDHFRQTIDVGPSILRIPRPGCWQLVLRSGGVVTRLTVIAVQGIS